MQPPIVWLSIVDCANGVRGEIVVVVVVNFALMFAPDQRASQLTCTSLVFNNEFGEILGPRNLFSILTRVCARPRRFDDNGETFVWCAC